MRTIIIDGGGSTTDVVLAIDGACSARTSLPSVKPSANELHTEELCRMLGSFLVGTSVSPDVDLNSRLDGVIIGMAGVWTSAENHRYVRAFRDSWEMYVGGVVPDVVVMSDAELVLFGAYGKKPGGVLIAGTGSIAVSRDVHGALHRNGGWGPRIDDGGGGFWLGRMACTAVARMLDGRGPETLLIRPVAAYVRSHAEDRDAVQNALRKASMDGVARIGLAVLTYADEGDAVAMQIRDEGAIMLAELVTTLNPTRSLPISGYGSLWNNATYASLIIAKCGQPIDILEDVLLACCSFNRSLEQR